ncbi:MAG: TIGR02281 family clan AA aspartic protease, partial [Legionellales bacterium]|nr:TIGR02281 family clan AA aspartic protease [Legionellales bacterium]
NSRVRVETTNSGDQIITLKVNRYNHYMVDGGVNVFEVNFLVDTGATRVSVPGHKAKEIGLKPDKEIRVLTASGETSAYTTIIDSLVIAGIEFLNVKATITPSDESNNVLLGMSILKKFSFVQEKGVLILKLNQD